MPKCGKPMLSQIYDAKQRQTASRIRVGVTHHKTTARTLRSFAGACVYAMLNHAKLEDAPCCRLPILSR